MLLENVRYNNVTNVEYALNQFDFSEQELHDAFHEACARGHVRIVELFLKDARINPAAPSTLAMDYAFAPNITYSFGLQEACYNGHADVVALLLQDKRSDPSDGHFRCITLILNKADQLDQYKPILKLLTEYCTLHGLDYQAVLGSDTYNKIQSILANIETPEQAEQKEVLLRIS